MKLNNSIRLFAALAAATLLLASCDQEKNKYVSSNITIDESGLNGAPSPESYTVTFTNTTTGDVVTAESQGTSVVV